jgi:hypothetical protein
MVRQTTGFYLDLSRPLLTRIKPAREVEQCDNLSVQSGFAAEDNAVLIDNRTLLEDCYFGARRSIRVKIRILKTRFL